MKHHCYKLSFFVSGSYQKTAPKHLVVSSFLSGFFSFLVGLLGCHCIWALAHLQSEFLAIRARQFHLFSSNSCSTHSTRVRSHIQSFDQWSRRATPIIDLFISLCAASRLLKLMLLMVITSILNVKTHIGKLMLITYSPMSSPMYHLCIITCT